jgi:hypothetical protein
MVQLCKLLCPCYWSWQLVYVGPLNIKRCRRRRPVWTPLLQLQQVAPLDLLGAAAAA